MGFQEDLLCVLFDGIAYRRFASVGATLCLVTANLYIYNRSSLYRPDSWVARGVCAPRTSASPSYLESTLAELSTVILGSNYSSTPR